MYFEQTVHVMLTIAILYIITLLVHYLQLYYGSKEEYLNLISDMRGKKRVDSLLLLNTIDSEKQLSAEKLCFIKNMIEKSISIPVSNLNDLQNVIENKASAIPQIDVEGLHRGDVGGSYSGDGSDKEGGCKLSRWSPEDFTNKSTMLNYLLSLIKEYNNRVLELNSLRMSISVYIDNFIRVFTESLNTNLLGMCTTCKTTDCNDVICAHLDKSVEIQKEKNIDLIEQKSSALNNMLCDFVKKYSFVMDLYDAILGYNTKLEKAWKEKKGEIMLNVQRV